MSTPPNTQIPMPTLVPLVRPCTAEPSLNELGLGEAVLAWVSEVDSKALLEVEADKMLVAVKAELLTPIAATRKTPFPLLQHCVP